MRGIGSGLVGGAVAIALTAYLAKRADAGGGPGQLRFGVFMWVLAVCCLAIALAPVVATLFFSDNKEFGVKAGIFVAFLVGAIYCFGEAALVRGRFDREGIEFSTPWTGIKRERWKDLASIRQNDLCNWNVLGFTDGKKVRLSYYLTGTLAALEAAQTAGGT